MAVGTCPTVRSSSVSLHIAVTICESPNVKPVDVRTTQARCPQAHRRNNNRPEQNKKCVTHVAGQNCYPCPRLLTTVQRILMGEGALTLATSPLTHQNFLPC